MNMPLPATHSIKRIIEALLFASKDPLSITKIRDVLHNVAQNDDALAHDASGASTIPSAQEIRKEIEELQQEYKDQERAFKIEEIANGYLLRSNEAYHPYLQMLFRTKKTDKLSNAALETLAIIAYKQPITKVEIEMIRGVDCSGVLHVLQERGLIEINGKLEAPGRPSLFATTKEFLKYFGINDISELPTPQLPAQAGVLGN